MTFEKLNWLLMFGCAAACGWLADASMAQSSSKQEFAPLPNYGQSESEAIELIPYRRFNGAGGYQRPVAPPRYQERAGRANFQPRPEEFGQRDGYEYRRPYRAGYQSAPDGFVAPNAEQAGEGSHSRAGGHHGRAGRGGPPGGCRRCQAHREQNRQQFDDGRYEDRPYNARRSYEGPLPYRNEADFRPQFGPVPPSEIALQRARLYQE